MLRALLKTMRPRQWTKNAFLFAALVFDGKLFHLPDLLRTLAENRGRVLSREQLLERVWGGSYFGEMRVVDVHLGHVRQKLGNPDFIVTVRGVGYRFDDEVL